MGIARRRLRSRRESRHLQDPLRGRHQRPVPQRRQGQLRRFHHSRGDWRRDAIRRMGNGDGRPRQRRLPGPVRRHWQRLSGNRRRSCRPTLSERRDLVFRNLGDGRFEELIDEAGPGVAATHSSRGCAFGDFDNDGDVDIIVMNMNEPPSLLRNDVSGDAALAEGAAHRRPVEPERDRRPGDRALRRPDPGAGSVRAVELLLRQRPPPALRAWRGGQGGLDRPVAQRGDGAGAERGRESARGDPRGRRHRPPSEVWMRASVSDRRSPCSCDGRRSSSSSSPCASPRGQTGNTASIAIDAAKVENRISPRLYGQFAEFMFENIKFGLHAELLRNRGFEESANAIGLPRHWERYPDDRNDDAIRFAWDDAVAYPAPSAPGTPERLHSLRIDVSAHDGQGRGLYQARRAGAGRDRIPRLVVGPQPGLRRAPDRGPGAGPHRRRRVRDGGRRRDRSRRNVAAVPLRAAAVAGRSAGEAGDHCSPAAVASGSTRCR